MTYKELLAKLDNSLPNVNLKVQDNFWWKSSTATLYYKEPPKNFTLAQEIKFKNILLHEVAHAKLGHQDYKSDINLLRLESEAWGLSKKLCQEHRVKFSIKEQRNSLQTYVNWSNARSICPKCSKTGLQNRSTSFYCLNCSTAWNVGKSRFRRTYRQAI